MEYYNAELSRFVCPCDGCSCTYKSLKTLNNHFNNKHPRNDKPVAIVNDMHRQSDAKYKAKIDAKAIVVDGLNYQAFKSAKWAELPAEMSFGDKNKAISAMWKEAKTGKTPAETVVTEPETQPEPVIEPVVDIATKEIEWRDEKGKWKETIAWCHNGCCCFSLDKDDPCCHEDVHCENEAKHIPLCDWVITAIRRIAEEMDVESIGDLHINPDQAEKAIELIKSMITTPKPIETVTEEPTIEPVIETDETTEEPTEEPKEDTWWDKTDDDVKTYDADLVECCKMWHCGGFARAYRLVLSPDELIIAESKETKAPYMMHTLGDRPQICSLPEVKTKLEIVWDAMCDAWCDYTNAEDFNPTDRDLFDDMIDYEDVADDLVNDETISGFFGF